MIKATEIVTENFIARQYRVTLVADTASEVSAIGSDGTTVEGLPKGATMTLGSACLTVTGEFGQIDSSGVWHF